MMGPRSRTKQTRLEPGQLRRLLAACDRRRVMGRRDYSTCSFCRGSACAQVKSPGLAWMTSTGGRDRSRCGAKVLLGV